MDAVRARDPRYPGPPSYPRERVPKQPVLSAASFTGYSRGEIPSVLDAGEARYVGRGSLAIGLALRHAHIGDGDEVLLPAYHCISMVEPVLWRGARPVFYRIRPDTSVNLADIESRLTGRTRALLVTHYFGFPQDMPRVRALCDARGIVLVEDCAHAFFGSIEGAPLGSFGDYAIASAWKFFPIYDGGILISHRRTLTGLRLEAMGPRFQGKALVNTLERAFAYRRLDVPRVLLKGPLWLKDCVLRQSRRAAASSASPSAVHGSSGEREFDGALVTKRMSIASRLITATASRQRITERRRRNYASLLAALRDVPGCRPLFDALPHGVVPQVFPLVYQEPERAFPLLRQAGVPIIRFGEFPWGGMDPSTCEVSASLSRSVFQFPCHQELDDAELDWMIAEVRSVSMRP